MVIKKIVCGGQTGIDRAALDFALKHKIDCGGWCPEGRKAEDGRIADKYSLIELPGAVYAERTEQNVIDSDATIILYYQTLTGGTRLSESFCHNHAKPYLKLDLAELSAEQAAQAIAGFVRRENLNVANFSGPRASEWPPGYTVTQQVLETLWLIMFVKCDDVIYL